MDKIDRDVAEKIISLAKLVGTSLSDLSHEIRKMEDDESRRAMLRAIAEMMIRVHEEISRPVTRIYPDLDVDPFQDEN